MNWNLKRTVEPSPPVTVFDIEEQTYLSDLSSETGYIENLIKRAAAFIEGPYGIGVLFGQQTWQLALDGFPFVIQLPVYPLVSVSSITYTDADGVEQTVSPDIYRVDTYSNPPRIALEYGKSWPASRLVSNSVKVEFVGGHSSTPDDLKHAVIMLVAHWYENREAASSVSLSEMPMGVQSILDKYRVMSVA